MLKVIYATSEMSPYAKTGGLADVSSALPQSLSKLGLAVDVFLPYYQDVQNCELDIEFSKVIEVPHAAGTTKATLHKIKEADNLNLYCIQYDPYFARPALYGEDDEYPDNAHRFAFFSRAIVEAERELKLNADVFHLHDWQTALVAAYLRASESKARVLFTIHNLAYQGRFWKWDLPWTGLDWSLFTPDQIEYFGEINFLKAGLLFADVVSTVGKTYATEIAKVYDPKLNEFDKSEGLGGVLMSLPEPIIGILNGIDKAVWNPATDNLIASNFSADNLDGKKECKLALRKHFGLPAKDDIPILGLVSRLTSQKGIDLLVKTLPELLSQGEEFQFVAIGTGDKALEKKLTALKVAYPELVSVDIGYSERVAHMIEAGADIFMMPSRYEPCGLNQMYSMTYGTIPVAHSTGGLKDTIDDLKTGFLFDEYSSASLAAALKKALSAFSDADKWGALMLRAMKEDFSWDKSAAAYHKIYERLCGE